MGTKSSKMPKSQMDKKQKSRPVTRSQSNTKQKLKKNRPDPPSDDESDIWVSEEEEEEEDTDSSYRPTTKKNRRIRVIESDDDICDEDDDGEELDPREFRKKLAQLFPSKYMNKKVKEDSKKTAKKNTKKSNQKKAKAVEEDEEDEEDDYYEDEDDEEDEDEDEEEEEEDDDDEDQEDEEGKFSLVFTYGGNPMDEQDEAAIEDDSNEECNSDDEEQFMKENYQKIEVPTQPEEIVEPSKKKKNILTRVGGSKSKKSEKVKETLEEEEDDTESKNVESEYMELVELKKHLSEKLKKSPKSKFINRAIEDCSVSIKELVQKTRLKNARKYHKMVNSANDQTSEIDYFKKKLSNKEQLRIMEELKEINDHIRVEKPYRLTLLDSNMPAKYKATVMQKVNLLRSLEPGDSEYHKIKYWVDAFMRVPFSIYKGLDVKMSDGIEKCSEFMERSKNILDNCVYGLDDAKMQIMQMVGQWIANPSAMGTAIAIKGPMGTGKCHGYNTPILMYDGTVKMVQDIIIGDLVMGDDSTPRNVVNLGRGEDEMYDVIMNGGSKYSVNSEHILCLKQSGMNVIKPIQRKNGTVGFKTNFFENATCKMHYKTFSDKNEAQSYLEQRLASQPSDIVQISVKNFLKLPRYISVNLKGYTTGVEFEPKPILFDPYIIGVWLGDGHSEKSMITNKDSAILSYLRKELKKDHLDLRFHQDYDYSIVSDEYNRPHPGVSKKTGFEYESKNVFWESIRHYDLVNNKHIPLDYKTNSRDVRLQLLAGLLDTDGWFDIENRYFEITQKNKKLSDDIVFVARSLGFCATQKECDKYCIYNGEKQYGLYYRVSIYGSDIDSIPTKCPRKQADKRPRHKNALVSEIKIIPKGIGNYYGFELDCNHRYVLGNFIVTHNTTMIKEGVSKLLGREFAFIALGGTGDASFLEGHSYTYEGSTWGKIVQILMDSKCMNPVIYFDELDKVSETARGEEIIGILTHLTDTAQNSQFHDKYFSEIDFDLSKCLFIFSYNDESKVNPILRDRMYRIQTKGYDAKEKIIIARNHLLPKIREQVNFSESDVEITEETLQYIISNKALTGEEAGVRNLKRCLEIIHTKLNLYRLMKPGSKLFGKEMEMEVSFPFTVTKKAVDFLIKNEEKQNQSLLAMYV
jgi:ATP-dependent Lon protease